MMNLPELNSKINLLSKESIKNAVGSAVLEISPEVAAYWLKSLNKSNRPLIEGHARELARRMVDGQWKLNGETVKFNESGEMLDGQHRCRAIVIYGKPVEIECRFGLGDVFETIDDGKKRTPGDALSVKGVANYNNAAATIGFIIRHKMDLNTRPSGIKISNRDVLEFYYNHQSLIDKYVLMGGKLYDMSARILSPSEFAAYMFLFSEKNVDASEKFLTSLALGANLSRKSPIFHLRAKLMQSKYDRQRSLTAAVKKWLIIKAWNFYRRGKEISQLKVDTTRESFPEIL